MPANTRAFSTFVGSSFRGTSWVEAFDSDGNSAYQAFDVSPDNTPGFGVYSPDSCSAITRIIVEPQDWGIGNFAINQDHCLKKTCKGSDQPVGATSVAIVTRHHHHHMQMRLILILIAPNSS